MLKQKEELKEGGRSKVVPEGWAAQPSGTTLGRRVFQEFCESISLHGYSYLSNANSILSKFFWFLVILVMTSLGIFLLVKNTTEYLNAGIVTTIQSSSSDLKVSIKLIFLIVFHYILFSNSSTGCCISFNYSL